MNHTNTRTLAIVAATFAALTVTTAATADSDMMSPGLMIPQMDPENGRALYASKGCVVCHAINGVGGQDAPMLDAEFMDSPMNPFDFAARMWRGAEVMVMMQRDELGEPIELTGQELADIIAFVHDPAEQALFSQDDIPENIADLIAE